MSELGNKKEALEAYNHSLKLNPRDPVTYYNRGVVLSELGKQEEALASFRAATQIMPKLAAPHLNAAAILIHLQRYTEARADIDQVLQQDPSQREALELLKRIPSPGNATSLESARWPQSDQRKTSR
jgi:tetratricopeptide (TPR) repeat protein